MLELNKIYNMDCIEGMKLLPDGTDEIGIDLIVTDPPYKTITGGKNNGKNSKRPKGVLNENNGLFKHQSITIDSWINELYRVLKNDSHCYIFTNHLNLEEMLTKSRLAGFKLHNLLVWEKNNCVVSQWYMKNCEYVLFLRKGKAKWINDIGGSKTVHKFNNIIGNKIHPTEKPVDLLEFYIANSSNEGDVVFDPFMGSGATAQACKNVGRDYLGFEIDEKYHEIAVNRLL
jgi:site-specific DNA-methyltransferase (adenine-specific)